MFCFEFGEEGVWIGRIWIGDVVIDEGGDFWVELGCHAGVGVVIGVLYMFHELYYCAADTRSVLGAP